MNKNGVTKSAASLALAALVSGAGVPATEAHAAELLGSGAELRTSLLRSTQRGESNATSPTPSPTPDSKSGEGKCGEGKCGGGKK